MEYYRRCNVCGHISCYTGEDLKNNFNNSLISGMTAFGSITNAFDGNKYDMYELNKISNNASNKIVNYQKCTHCGSVDTFLVTKKFTQFTYKNPNRLDETILIEEAKKYLANSDYENAFCFANVACHDNESCHKGYLIKFLATYHIKSIDEIKTIKDDYSENQHFIDLYNHSNNILKNQLFNLCHENKKKNLKQEARNLLNSELNNKKLKEIKKIKVLMETNDLSNEEEYQKIKEYITNYKKAVAKIKSTIKKITLIVLVITFIFVLMKYFINQHNNYNSIMTLLKNDEFYNGMTNYYEKLNPITQKKVKTYLIDKVNKHTWASRRTEEYKDSNGNTCTSREYITFGSDNTMTTYIKCPKGYEAIEALYKESHKIDLNLNGYDGYDEYQLSLVSNKYYLSLEDNTYYITYDETNRTEKVEDEVSVKNSYVSISYNGGTEIYAGPTNSYVIVEFAE